MKIIFKGNKNSRTIKIGWILVKVFGMKNFQVCKAPEEKIIVIGG